MKLQDCLDILARGKLSNLALIENGKVKEASVSKVVDAINEALSRLYTVLPIKEKSLLIELREGRTSYPLTSDHSWRKQPKNAYNYDYYIIDTEENPFEDDILVITEAWDDIDRVRPINDPDNPFSILVTESNLIVVNDSFDGRVLNIAYRAKHLFLTADDLTSKVQLPENLYGALFSYTAYLIHSDMNTEVAVANAQKYLTEYQAIVNEIILNSTLSPDKSVSDMKFIKRGWV